MLRTLITLVFWLITIPITALLTLPWALLTGDIRPLYVISMWLCRTGVKLLGIRVVAEGLDRLDAGGTYIFMSNHASNVDPPILMPLIPRRTSVLVKAELMRIPIFGHAMRIARLVPVERGNRERAISSLDSAAKVLQDGINLMVYVEGTRSPDGRLLPFKRGPFDLAVDNGVPIVPVTIVGSHAAMPKGRLAVHPGTVRVVFHEPVDPRRFADKDSLMEAVRERIASALENQQQEISKQ